MENFIFAFILVLAVGSVVGAPCNESNSTFEKRELGQSIKLTVSRNKTAAIVFVPRQSEKVSKIFFQIVDFLPKSSIFCKKLSFLIDFLCIWKNSGSYSKILSAFRFS